TINITPLPPSYLGLAYANSIWLSPDAGGYEWVINPSPSGPNPPAGRGDLLTVVPHAVGHLLRSGDDPGQDVMGEFLTPGVRILPAAVTSGLGAADPRLDPGTGQAAVPDVSALDGQKWMEGVFLQLRGDSLVPADGQPWGFAF